VILTPQASATVACSNSSGLESHRAVSSCHREEGDPVKVGKIVVGIIGGLVGLVAIGLVVGGLGGLILARPNDELARKLNSIVFPGMQGGPLMHVIAAKAVALKEALEPQFTEYQKQVLANSRAMCRVLIERGFRIVSGGTDNHLFLVDLIERNLTGKDADAALNRANITVNKNAVPNDPRPPFVTSGLRMGTPAITTRGFGVREAENLSHWIADVLADAANATLIEQVRRRVLELCARYPVYA